MAVHRRRGQGPHSPEARYESVPGIACSIDASGILRTTFSGPLALPQLILHLQARERAGLLANPQVVDARDATLELSTADVRKLAALAREVRRRTAVGPTALVASRDLSYGIGRMYAGFDASDSAGFAVFRSMEEAERWLKELQ
jgi:hypothetical protein